MDNAGVQENYEDYDNVPEIYAVDYEPYYNTLYISGNKLGMQTGNVYIQTTAGRKLIPAEDIIQWSESGIRLKIRDGSIGNIIIETYDCKFSNEDISIGNSELLSKYLLREDFESAAEGELQASVWDVSVSAKASIQTKSEQKLMELKGNNPNLEVTWLGGTGSSRRFGNNITTFDFQFPNGSSSYNGLYNLLRQSSAGTKYTLDVRPSYSPAFSKVTGAKQYDVYRSAKVSSGFRKIGTATVTSYKDKKATPGKTWYYKVVAVSRIAGNNSAMSGAARISMLKKPSIKVKSMNSGQVTVKWNKIKGVKGYQIYVSTKKTGGLKKKLTLMKASKVKSTVKKLKSGRKYYFKVRAYKKINGKKIYGAFSKAKGIEVK